jgi:hypothetical protein
MHNVIAAGCNATVRHFRQQQLPFPHRLCMVAATHDSPLPPTGGGRIVPDYVCQRAGIAHARPPCQRLHLAFGLLRALADQHRLAGEQPSPVPESRQEIPSRRPLLSMPESPRTSKSSRAPSRVSWLPRGGPLPPPAAAPARPGMADRHLSTPTTSMVRSRIRLATR